MKSCPVKHTCPDINQVINDIKRIIKQIDNYYDDVEDVDFKNFLKDAQQELSSIAVGNNCSMENLRDANSSLRDWGQECYDYATEKEEEISNLEYRISNLESENDDLSKNNLELLEEKEELQKEIDSYEIN